MHGTFEILRNLLTPARLDENIRRRQLVLTVLLATTVSILILSALLLCISYGVGHHFVLHRLVGVMAAIIVVLALVFMARLRHFFFAASGLLILYTILASAMAASWSISVPVSVLLFAVIIVLAGMLLGSKYSLYYLVVSVLIIISIQLATAHGLLHPNTYWEQSPSHLTDIIGYCLIFSVLGVSSWLFNRQTDIALHQALRAEVALTREKELLEIKVVDRTRELQEAQMDKMQQLHRFAQLGQLSTSLLHDLSNHITTLSIDIEGIEEAHHSRLMKEAKRNIHYIDGMVQWAYDHLNDRVQLKTFNVHNEIDEVLTILQHSAQIAHVTLQRVSLPKGAPAVKLRGDPGRFRQIVSNLVSNAIDAYKDISGRAKQVVAVGVRESDNVISVTVTDNGKGIPADIQTHIFEPFYSTKHTGTGIGLFIVKQSVEDFFGGSITVSSKPGKTIFTVTLKDHRA